MKVLMAGATGCVGGWLVPGAARSRTAGALLEAGQRGRCAVCTPAKLDDRPWHDVEGVAADRYDPASLRGAAPLKGAAPRR